MKLVKTWFHGTTSDEYESLIKGIDINYNPRKMDFGQGFYLTSNFHQASKHAKDRAKKISATPLVFVYNLNLALFTRLKGKTLPYKNEEWAWFIYYNRSEKYFKTHDYDYVFGGVADAIIDDLIEDADEDRITLKEFLQRISIYKSYDQLSLNTLLSIDEKYLQREKVVIAYERNNDYR